MATLSTGHLPELTAELAQEVFAAGLGDGYTVCATNIRMRDFIVKQSEWAGVGVRLKQERDKTVFVFTAMMPNAIMHALIGGPASSLFLRSRWKRLESEIADFIAMCPQFQPSQQAPVASFDLIPEPPTPTERTAGRKKAA